MEGRVIKTTGSWYEVKVGDKMIKARLRGKFKQDNLKLTNPIAVGDYVILDREKNQETAVINTIVPRENYIIRKSTRKQHFSHILAANVDQAYLMVTVRDPRTSLGFIDRFLVSTESFRIPCTLLVNKIETLTKKKDLDFLEELHDIYGPLGYPIIELSALHDKDLMEKFEPGLTGKTTLMAGHSGVGKSTLLNRLVPQATQATQEVSKFSSSFSIW